jgi:hypothetical protein
LTVGNPRKSIIGATLTVHGELSEADINLLAPFPVITKLVERSVAAMNTAIQVNCRSRFKFGDHN